MKEIIISTPRIKVPSECPECNNKFEFPIKKVRVVCSRCKYIFLKDIASEPNKYYIDMIENILSKNNELIIKTTKQYENSLKDIRDLKINQKCWEVSEISDDKDIEKKRKCLDCGKCNNCSTCLDCGHHYIIKNKKPKCPKCGSKRVKPTLIKKFEKRDEINICPFCKSENIYWTYFYKGDVCPICGGKNIKYGKEINIKKLIIKRLPKFRIE